VVQKKIAQSKGSNAHALAWRPCASTLYHFVFLCAFATLWFKKKGIAQAIFSFEKQYLSLQKLPVSFGLCKVVEIKNFQICLFAVIYLKNMLPVKPVEAFSLFNLKN
jgi:hypothetical protein